MRPRRLHQFGGKGIGAVLIVNHAPVNENVSGVLLGKVEIGNRDAPETACLDCLDNFFAAKGFR